MRNATPQVALQPSPSLLRKRRRRTELRQVRSGRKRALAGPPKYNYAHIVINLDGVERGPQRIAGSNVDGVQHLGPVEGDEGDVAADHIQKSQWIRPASSTPSPACAAGSSSCAPSSSQGPR